jgi:hypothetical protein
MPSIHADSDLSTIYPGMGLSAVIDIGDGEREVRTAVMGRYAGRPLKLSDASGRPPWQLASADDAVGRDILYLSAPLENDTSEAHLEAKWASILEFWKKCMAAGRGKGVLLACRPGARGWVTKEIRKLGKAKEGDGEEEKHVTGLERVGPVVCAMLGVWAMERQLQWYSWVELGQVLAARTGVDTSWADEIRTWQNQRRDWGSLVNRMRDKLSERALLVASSASRATLFSPDTAYAPSDPSSAPAGIQNVPKAILIDEFLSKLGVTDVEVLHSIGFSKHEDTGMLIRLRHHIMSTKLQTLRPLHSCGQMHDPHIRLSLSYVQNIVLYISRLRRRHFYLFLFYVLMYIYIYIFAFACTA